MARGDEALVPQGPHDLQTVLGHDALGVGLVMRIAHRHGAGAIAAQVGHDERGVAGQLRRDSVPASVRLRIAVQQEQRRPRAPDAQEYLGAAVRGYAVLGEAGEQIGDRIHDPLRSRAMARQPMSVR
jgi:hypothetical protein